MKIALHLVLLLSFFSCSDGSSNKPPATNTTKKTPAVLKSPPQNPYAPLDLSPLDISYFPVDYPIEKMRRQGIDDLPVARVIYGRPHKQGRTIFGNLLKYGEPWRLGANEATEIEFFQPVSIQGKRIGKERFVIYAIPEEKHWTIIFNRNAFSWGLQQDSKQDVYRFTVPVEKSNTPVEYFTMVFEKAFDGGMNLLIAWDDVVVRLPIKY